MANASHKHVGAGAQGKGDGTGALTTAEVEDVPDAMVLSNRDKAQRGAQHGAKGGDQRGLDGQAVQTEQMRDHAADRQAEPAVPLADEPEA